jgi:hydroxyacylglutathione hydrolase
VDEGLGNSSYLIASEATGLAAVIDPQRDVDRYLRRAEGLGLRLQYALDTHLHNDFVSGVRELAALAGVQIGASALAELGFAHQPLREGDALPLGELSVGVLATAGHTPEHLSFTLTEPGQSMPAAVFTGGALMVGGAARTDLLGSEWTMRLAEQLYHSLHNKLLKLPDNVAVYPTHGAGSFCAAPATGDRTTTIGRERASNRLAQVLGMDSFVQAATADLPSYPTYFHAMRRLNQRGPAVLGQLPSLRPLPADRVRNYQTEGAAIVDLRPSLRFVAGHIPGAHSVALRAAFGAWVGWVVPFGTPIVLVTDEDPAQHEDAVRQLIRLGYDQPLGYLAGGMDAWQAAGGVVSRWEIIPPQRVRERLRANDGLIVVDVRQANEWQAGHVPGAVHIEAGQLTERGPAVAVNTPIAVHCGHHDRSVTGLALLERQGFHHLLLMEGGMAAWAEAGFEVERG